MMDQKTWELLLEDIKIIRSDVKDVKKTVSLVDKRTHLLEYKATTLASVFVFAITYIKNKFFH